MKNIFSLAKRLMIVTSLCLLIVACNRLTQENFDKIKPSMKMKEVVAILGEPTSSDSINIAGVSGTAAVWKDKKTEITIQFLNDEVLLKSMTSADEQTLRVR